MEKKKPSSVAKQSTSRRVESREQVDASTAENGNDNGDGSARHSPLGARFFDTQAELSSGRQRLLRRPAPGIGLHRFGREFATARPAEHP